MESLSWSLGSIIYHIYVRSFQDSNHDGIGDINGLITRLDYIASLGANALWLSPIYPSPQADFGYDVADYTNIDPLYGSLSDFENLLTQSHKRGMRVMMDFVPNHTSIKHRWFQESSLSKDNPKRDWYIWRPPKSDGSLPNNWLSVFGGTAWEFDESTGEYYLHTFDKGQPDLNWRNPEVVEAMLSVLRFWMDLGIDGFRVDVPYHMFKTNTLDDEPTNPNFVSGVHGEYESLMHIHTSWLDESFAMMKEFVSVLKEYEHKFMVTEAWGTIDDLLKLYKTVDWKYYAPFNFSLITLPWRADVHKQYIDEYDAKLGEAYLPCYVLGNHDRPRVASRIGEKQARNAALLELSLRGLPFIYYGEELGMTDTPIPRELVKDTFEINSPGLGLGRDPQRTPMQWDNTENSGFSTSPPWLPLNPEWNTVNVGIQENDPRSMLSLYKLLIKLRKHHISLREGRYEALPLPGENVLAFLRKKAEEEILVIINFDTNDTPLSLPYSSATVLTSTQQSLQEGTTVDLTHYTLPSDEGLILLLPK